jgi:hypothetical protein
LAEEEMQENEELLEGESTEEEEVTPTVSYDVTSYGSDPEVEVLVNRLRRGEGNGVRSLIAHFTIRY